jgi:hypothetical protein
MEEQWRPIPGWEGGYEASSLGRIKSLARKVRAKPRGGKWCWINRKERILTASAHGKGRYMSVTLNFNGYRQEGASVAHLVAVAFLGPRPRKKHVCHNNGDPSDNRIENLRYDTAKGNQADRDKHGRTQKGEQHYRAKLTIAEVREIRATYKGRKDRYKPGHIQQIDLMAKYGIGRRTLQHILAGRTWKDA